MGKKFTTGLVRCLRGASYTEISQREIEVPSNYMTAHFGERPDK